MTNQLRLSVVLLSLATTGAFAEQPAESPLDSVVEDGVVRVTIDDQLGEAIEHSAVCGEGCDCCAGHDWSWSLDKNGRGRLGGWVQQGITWNPDNPTDRFNTPVGFNDRSNDYQMNQLYLFAERSVEADGCAWEVGGRVDLMFGTDFRFVTVPGLEEHPNGTRRWNSEDRRFYGLAMPQVYGEVAAPIGNGLSVKLGHFYTTMGYETITAPDNFFYSHAYTMLYGEPFTHTGALATYNATDKLTVHGGITRGWDNWENHTDEWGFLGGFRWSDGCRWLAFTTHMGNDFTGTRLPGGTPLDDERFAYSLVFGKRLTDRWRYVFQHDYGHQADRQLVISGPSTTFDTARWYGINQYLFYDINACWTAGLRFEWFRDQDSGQISIPIVLDPGGPTFIGNNYYAVTAGLNYQPHPNVMIRPELRMDWSDFRGNASAGVDPAIRAFDRRTSRSQFLAAIDVVLTF